MVFKLSFIYIYIYMSDAIEQMQKQIYLELVSAKASVDRFPTTLRLLPRPVFDGLIVDSELKF